MRAVEQESGLERVNSIFNVIGLVLIILLTVVIAVAPVELLCGRCETTAEYLTGALGLAFWASVLAAWAVVL